MRQPLSKIIVDGKYRETIGDLCALLEEELNIKEVDFEDNLGDFMNYTLKPDFKVAGPILGKNVKLLGKALATVNPGDVVAKLEAGESVAIDLEGETIALQKDFIDIRISAKEGFNVQMFNNKFIILDTTLNQELLAEGCAREFVSRIQQLRKSNGYEVMDRIDIAYASDEQMDRAIAAYSDFIKTETLADQITIQSGVGETFNLNGHDTTILLQKK